MSNGPLDVRPGLTIPEWELWWTATRSSGAGGQHVNRTESAVILHFSVPSSSVLSESQKQRLLTRLGPRLTQEGVLQVRAETHRSQHRNLDEARERMAGLLRDALHVAARRVATRPTRGSVERRIQGKKEAGQKKQLRGRVNED